MQLRVLRTTFTNKSTIGELYVDGEFECYTLEDVVRPVKIPGMTAISEGIYQVDVTFSARFKRLLPELRDVPNFQGVRIHPGNTDADTEGCILVGQTKARDFIGNSRAAFAKLFPRIEAARKNGKIFIEVTTAVAPAAAARAFGGLAHRGITSLAPAGRSVAKTRRKKAAKAATRAAKRPSPTRKAAARTAKPKAARKAGKRAAATARFVRRPNA
jgi:hypothetical protein